MDNDELARELDERIENLIALVAATKKWNPLLHPRGKDGKFIEKGGWIRGLLTFIGKDKKSSKSKKPERAEVLNIRPNPDDANNPILDVRTSDGRVATVIAGDVDVAPSPKASLRKGLPDDGIDEFNNPVRELTPNEIRDIQRQPGDPVLVSDMDEALRLLAEGTKIELVDSGQIAVLLDKMREIVADAKTKGEDAPNYDLCNVTARGSSLFCVESKGIPRIKMPQLSGVPTPGTEAAELTPDSRGEVDLGPAFREMLEARGIQITDERVEAQRLKASQNELSGPKTAGIAFAIENGTYDESALFISNDNYIVDGHHRWSAMIGVDSRDPDAAPLEMPVQRVDMSILDLLAEANEFAIAKGIPQQGVTEGQVFGVTDDGTGAPLPDVPDDDGLVEGIAKRTIEDGGSTTFVGGEDPGAVTTGKSVSSHPERSKQLAWPMTVEELDNALAEYQTENADLLDQDGFALGTWVDTESDTLWLDVSSVVATNEEAEALSAQYNQIAYFDLDTGQEVRTGGTGEAIEEVEGADALAQGDTLSPDSGSPVEEVSAEREALAAELRERVYELEAAQNRIGWNMAAPGAGEALRRRQQDLRDRVQAARSELEAIENGAPVSSSGKVLDAMAVDYGLVYDGSFENNDYRMAALEWDGWGGLPIESVDPKTLIAVEERLQSKAINKVVSGEVPLREGYVVKVARTPEGQLVIVDGHHRAAMAAAMGRDLDVQIASATALQRSPSNPAAFTQKIASTQLGPGDPIPVSDVEEAVRLLADGQKIKLSSPDQVSTLLDKLRDIVNEAKAAGDNPPNFDLCNVTAEGSSLFCVESKGIPRIKMPQLSGRPLPGSKADEYSNRTGSADLSEPFREYLTSKGVSIEDASVLAGHLKASQNELNGAKVAGMTGALEAGTLPPGRIFVSRDNYVVDGHHRWAANVAADLRDGEMDMEMDVARIDMDIIDLLAEANNFSLEWGIPQASAINVGERPPIQPLSDKHVDHPLAETVRTKMATIERIEPEITDTLESIITPMRGQLIGLDFRFKTADGVLEKAERKSKMKGISPDEGLRQIDDALRYTTVLPVEDHAGNARMLIASMREAGYDIQENDIENNWRPGDAYNGINMVFTHSASGERVEMQIHTADSFYVKQYGTHEDYEIFRNPKTPWRERKEAFDRMQKKADSIRFPEDIMGIGVEIFRPFEEPAPDELFLPDAPAAPVV